MLFRSHNDPLAADDDNDISMVVGTFRTKPFLTGPTLDSDGKPIYEDDGQSFKINNSISLGFVNGGRGFLGNWIWDDENYNGIMDTFEKGIGNVTVTLKSYYYDDGKWNYIEGKDRFIKTAESGSYVFQNVMSYYNKPDDSKMYLMGYRLMVDPEKNEELYKNYAITKYKQYTKDRSTENSDIYYKGDMKYYLIGDDWTDYNENGEPAGEYSNYNYSDDMIIIAGQKKNSDGIDTNTSIAEYTDKDNKVCK